MARIDLINDNINKTLVKMTIPMIFGMLGFVIFNVTDTFFISRLGTTEMAALTFTFPIVFIIGSMAMGLGQGTSVLISRAYGSGDHEKATRYVTDSLILGVAIVTVLAIAGLLTIDKLFTFMGATPEMLVHIKAYMQVWYSCVFFVIIPMMGNAALRATGDTKTPGIIMSVSAITNIILDPIFIFGYGFIPAMGVRGAAIATVLARTLTVIVSLYMLIVREKLIKLKKEGISERIRCMKEILKIGTPVAFARSMNPVGVAIITNIMSKYGDKAVAAFGVSSRIEFLALCITISLANIMGPFVGQNIGAKKKNRVRDSIISANIFSVILGFVFALLFYVFGENIAGIFNKDKEVVKYIVMYLTVVPISYCLAGTIMISNSILNVFKKSVQASALSLAQMFVIYIPLAYFLSGIFNVKGIFIALALTFIISGIAGLLLVKNYYLKLSEI